MKRSFRGLIASCACLLTFSTAQAAPPGLKVDRVLMLMRHGVRPPTKLQPIPEKYAPQPWPQWSVAPGLLTPHGAKGIGLLGAADRAWFADEGLISAVGCPPNGEVTILASKVPRAISTAEAWANSAFHNCGLVVQHPGKDQPDLLFHILETKPSWFDGHLAYESALAQAPKGGLERQMQLLAPQMEAMEKVLACPQPCPLESEPTKLVEQEHDAPRIDGPFNAASTASETFLLEYLDGKPLSEVGWGRINRPQIESLLTFNITKFIYLNRAPYIAKATARPLLKVILNTLNAQSAARVTLLAGHDTNIAELAGLLNMHWRPASYLADDVPPGSALGFELLSDGQGRHFVRAFFRSQTMDQLRSLQPLTGRNGPYREYLDIPGCGRGSVAFSCDLRTFTRAVESKLR